MRGVFVSCGGLPRLFARDGCVTMMSTRSAESSPVELHTLARTPCASSAFFHSRAAVIRRPAWRCCAIPLWNRVQLRNWKGSVWQRQSDQAASTITNDHRVAGKRITSRALWFSGARGAAIDRAVMRLGSIAEGRLVDTASCEAFKALRIVTSHRARCCRLANDVSGASSIDSLLQSM